MSLTFGLFTQVSDSGPTNGPLFTHTLREFRQFSGSTRVQASYFGQVGNFGQFRLCTFFDGHIF